MKITYIMLKNYAGIQVGLGTDELEIDFSKSINRIIAIQAKNGSGKSVLLAALSPFAYTSSLDDRSTLSLITPHKNGYKEIHFKNGDDAYIIKHYYKALKDSHSVKSYFMKNGEELNENGNVTSFNSLVEIHFGLTADMMRLIRIGSNVNSFISLTPAKRKEYIGNLIEEIDLYLKIYKKVNDDIRIVKTLLQSNATNLYNCHISDPVVEQENLVSIRKEISTYEAERDKLVGKIGKIDSLMRDNDIEELRRRLNETESSIHEFEKISAQVERNNLQDKTIDELIELRNALTNKRIDVQSKINSLRLSIDNIHKNIERLEASIKKITSNNDLHSLINNIENLKKIVSSTSDSIINFKPLSKSEDLQTLLSKLQSFNQIGKMICTFGNKPISVYLDIKKTDGNVDRWLKDQAKKSLSRINEVDVKALIDQVFGDDQVISPNCDTEFNDCPFYRLHTVITDIHDKIEEESYSDETLRYIQLISNNIDNILNEIDRMRFIKVPDNVSDGLTEQSILNRLNNKLPLFDLSNLQEYLSITREYELYVDSYNRLSQYQSQLIVYQQAGIGSYSEEIKHQQEQIDSYRSDIEKFNDELRSIQHDLEKIESNIALVTRYRDGLKYQKMMNSTVESTKKILEPLETAVAEKRELQFQLRQEDNLIALTREKHNSLERKLDQYNKLLKEGEKLSKQNKDLNIIMEAVSTKKGIPTIYMKKYLGKIRKLANDLLRFIYDDSFRLAPFNVTPDSFEIPYIRNGRVVSDLKFASQSELALGTLALSFALATNASGKYNILCLDEIDAGLDADARASFLKMLYTQMETIDAEQAFIISHNMSQLTNLEMDTIRLDDSSPEMKLQNVIYQA